MRKKRRATSVSSVLEEILQAVRRHQEQARVEQLPVDPPQTGRRAVVVVSLTREIVMSAPTRSS